MNGLRAGAVLILWLGAGASANEGNSEARHLMDAKRYDEALPLIERSLEANPDDVRALAMRAELLRRTERTDEARRDYERLTRLRPGDPDPWFWLGTLDRWRGRDEDSARAYGRAIALEPCHLDALKGRARVRRHAKDHTGAQADLRAALVCRPRDPEATELLAELVSRSRDPVEAERILRETFRGAELEGRLGDLALSSGHPAAAAGHYGRALAQAPEEEDASLLRRLGDAERERGRSEAALEAYRRAVERDGGDMGSLYWVGVLATRAGRREEAIAAFEGILARKPQDAGALVGKARLLHAAGLRPEALEIVDRVLAASPENAEARTLRAAILASSGRTDEALLDYRAVILAHPRDVDARSGLDRLVASRSFGVEGRSDRTEVVEGLDEAGLETDTGITIEPTRVEYLRDGGEADLRWRLREGVDLGAEAALGREAVTNLDPQTGGVIYDFDVLAVGAGLDHRLSDRWDFSWRLGGTRYDSRDPGTIEDESHFKGSAVLERRGPRSRFLASLSRSSFIHRGFAGDFQFRIFTRNRLSLEREWSLPRSFSLRTAASVSDFDDGNRPVFSSIALGWSRGERVLSLGLRHDPFPARFLDANRRLQFIRYDVISLTGRTPLGGGLRLSGDLLAARFSETSRTLEIDTDGDGVPNRVAGPLERNRERRLQAELSWTPSGFKPLSLGAEYTSDHYRFDTAPYNTNDLHAWQLFAELADEPTPRWRYAARYARGLIGDERDESYTANSYYGSLDVRLGRLDRPSGTPRLGLEALVRDNSIGENADRYRFYLRVPF